MIEERSENANLDMAFQCLESRQRRAAKDLGREPARMSFWKPSEASVSRRRW